MILRISIPACLGALTLMAFVPASFAQTAPPAPRAEFTDSTAAGLAPTKRVAITSVIVSFQASVGAKQDSGSGMFADKSSSDSMMSMPYMDQALQDEITALAYRQLKADLMAAGFEVVPEAEVAADASYREIISKVGFVNHSRSLNALGAAVLVSPPTLIPYMPYGMEGGGFQVLAQGKGDFLTWPPAWGKVSAWGKPLTPGGYSLMTSATFYKLPGLEVAMAKSLNANLVKATYVVNLGQTSTGHSRFLGEMRGRSAAHAQLSLLADQTRVAFRSPTGNAKWQKVNLNKPAPAKDGDVVVRLAETMLGGTEYFNVVLTESRDRNGKYDYGAFRFSYDASINDNAAYQRDVQAMIANSTHSMVELVKR